MKVYIVINTCEFGEFGEISPYNIIQSVFLSEELAQEYIDSYPPGYCNYFDIIEMNAIGD